MTPAKPELTPPAPAGLPVRMVLPPAPPPLSLRLPPEFLRSAPPVAPQPVITACCCRPFHHTSPAAHSLVNPWPRPASSTATHRASLLSLPAAAAAAAPSIPPGQQLTGRCWRSTFVPATSCLPAAHSLFQPRPPPSMINKQPGGLPPVGRHLAAHSLLHPRPGLLDSHSQSQLLPPHRP
jgi:hypothetical protein